ncbi:MAG: NAD(P)-dependent oxidoreductase, partial [Planctomycetes bacterium]|nr:NAD(P)-dependent oxidoreductase [Planctomycetota bacterium]
MRVLLTGGSGFIGANLCRRLLDDGCEVHLLLRNLPLNERLRDLEGRVLVHCADLRARESVLSIVRGVRPEQVFHLATYGGSSQQTDVREMVATNIDGTVNLVEACLKSEVRVVVNTGSSSEYGFKDRAAREEDRLDPNSHYAWTK